MTSFDFVYSVRFREGRSDKVWGIIKQTDEIFYVFWGRTGRTLQFQKFPKYYWEQDAKYQEKIRKGYRDVPGEDMIALFPGDGKFRSWNEQLVIMILGDKAREKSGFTY